MRSDLNWTNFKNQFDELYDTLHAINRMVLKLPLHENDGAAGGR